MTRARSLADLGGPADTGLFFRNRIINGDMRIDQRNNGASVIPLDGQYSLDRWGCYRSQASRFAFQQNAGSVTPPAGFTNYLGITSLSSYSSIASDYLGVAQSIEGFNCADFAFGTASARTVNLSFLVRSSLTGTFGGSLRNSAFNRSYVFSYTISAANTWEFKTITIPGDAVGQWLTNNGIGINVWFDLGSGSNFTGAPGSWLAANLLRPSGSVSLVGVNNATWQVTGIQLEAGSVATPFERRPYGTELALCQRYYEVLPLNASGFSITGGFFNTADYRAHWFFKQTKRALPTLTGSWIAGPTVSYVSTDNSVYYHTAPSFYNTSALTASAEL